MWWSLPDSCLNPLLKLLNILVMFAGPFLLSCGKSADRANKNATDKSCVSVSRTSKSKSRNKRVLSREDQAKIPKFKSKISPAPEQNQKEEKKSCAKEVNKDEAVKTAVIAKETPVAKSKVKAVSTKDAKKEEGKPEAEVISTQNQINEYEVKAAEDGQIVHPSKVKFLGMIDGGPVLDKGENARLFEETTDPAFQPKSIAAPPPGTRVKIDETKFIVYETNNEATEDEDENQQSQIP